MNGYRVFAASLPGGNGPPRPTRGPAFPRPLSIVKHAPTPDRLEPIATELSRILDATQVGEPLQRAFDRKERGLYALFDSLGEVERTALHVRLTTASDDDEIVAKLHRFTAERRQRILSVLAPQRSRLA